MNLLSGWALNLTDFTVIVAEQVYRDTKEAIFFKESLETYASTEPAFVKEITTLIKRLETFTKIYSNLSLRISIDSHVKYQMIDGYILSYELVDLEVYVLRLLPEKSN